MQKRFTHFVNQLVALGKKFKTKELNIKILKSLNKFWKPKVILSPSQLWWYNIL